MFAVCGIGMCLFAHRTDRYQPVYPIKHVELTRFCYVQPVNCAIWTCAQMAQFHCRSSWQYQPYSWRAACHEPEVAAFVRRTSTGITRLTSNRGILKL